MTLAEQLLKRWDRMREERRTWEPIWQDISDVIHPRRSNFVVQRTPGTKQTEKLFDSTALNGNERLASTLNGTLTSKAIQWFSLKLRDEALDEIKEVDDWLESCTKRMYRAYNQSNFASETNEMYVDETSLGTAGLFVEERKPESKKFAGLVFRALPLTDLWIDEDAEGRVDTVFRSFDMTARVAVDKWGIENAGEKLRKAIDENKSDTVFHFLHAIYPRTGVGTPTAATPKTKLPWASVYVCIDDKKKMSEGGFHEFPCMVPRWAKTAGEKYGRGPGHIALPDVKTLNKIKEITLKAMGKALDPPMKQLEDSVIGPVRNVPGGLTTVNRPEGLEPLFPAGMFREMLGNESIKSAELQKAIKDIFFDDLTSLPLGTVMTATEVLKRFELIQRKLGPVMGQLETEFLNPLSERVFGIMYRHGAFADAPDVLMEAGADIDVEYEGPLAKSQRLSQVDGMDRLLQSLTVLMQIDPQAIDNLDVDEAVRLDADILGVPSKIIRSKEDVLQIRSDRAKQQAEQQKKADLAQLGETAGKAAPALKIIADQRSGAAA